MMQIHVKAKDLKTNVIVVDIANLTYEAATKMVERMNSQEAKDFRKRAKIGEWVYFTEMAA